MYASMLNNPQTRIKKKSLFYAAGEGRWDTNESPSIGKRWERAFLDNVADEKSVSLLLDQSTSTFLSLDISRASAEMKNVA